MDTEVANGQDIVDVSVPPIPDEQETIFLNDDGDVLSAKFAKHAQETSGIVGPIGVALVLLNEVENSLNSLSERSDVDTAEIDETNSLVQETSSILVAAADQHIADDSSKLYDVSNLESTVTTEERRKQGRDTVSTDQFAKVSVDGMNGKGNILARPDHLQQDHLHLSHGQVGEEVVIYLGSDSTVYSGRMQNPVLPFESVEAAAREFTEETTLRLKEGDLLKLMNPTPVSETTSTVSVEGFNVDEIELEEDIPEKRQITIRIRSIQGSSARGKVENSRLKHQHRRKRKNRNKRRSRNKSTKKKNRKSNSNRYNGKGNGGNPFGSSGGERNSLIRDNLR